MSGLAELRFLQHCKDSRLVCPFKYFCVRDFILPLHFQQFVEAAEVEVLQLLGMLLEDCPSFRSIKEGRQNNCFVDFQLGGQADPFLLPH